MLQCCEEQVNRLFLVEVLKQVWEWANRLLGEQTLYIWELRGDKNCREEWTGSERVREDLKPKVRV